MRLLSRTSSDPGEPVLGKEDVLEIVASVRNMDTSAEVIDYATRLARASRPGAPDSPDFIKKYVGFGAGPRAAQALVLGAKALALMTGQAKPTCADIRSITLPVFRHRVVPNFLATGDGIDTDALIARLIDTVPAPDRPAVTQKKKGGLFAFFAKKS